MKGFIRFNLQLECDYASWVLTYRCVQCTDVIDVVTGYLEIDSYREWFAERHYTGENRFGWMFSICHVLIDMWVHKFGIASIQQHEKKESNHMKLNDVSLRKS